MKNFIDIHTAEAVKKSTEELEKLEQDLGTLLEDVQRTCTENTSPSPGTAMLELRTEYLRRRAETLQQTMQALTGLDHTTTTLLNQQTVIAGRQKNTLERLAESLKEMSRAESTTARADLLLQLHRLKDSLDRFGHTEN